MRFSSTLLACVLAAAPLFAQAEDLLISAVEITGYGLFEGISERRTPYSGTSVAADNVRNVEFIKFTQEVPGELKTNFGLQYVVNTTPKGSQFPVTQVIRFPEGGLRQPGGRLYKKSEEDKKIQIGEPVLHGFGFDERWEIVPGEWVFEVWHRKAMLLRKTFTVTVPEVADSN